MEIAGFVDQLLKLFIAGGVIFCSHDALQGFLINNKTPYGRAAGLLSFCGAVFLLFSYLALEGSLLQPPYLNYCFIASLFALGPATYMFFVASVNPDYQVRWLRRMRFIPAGLVLAGLPAAYHAGWYDFDRHPLAWFWGGEIHFLDYLFAASLLHNFIYYFLIFRKSRHIFTIRAARDLASASIFRVIFFLITIIGMLSLLSFPLREDYLLHFACFFTSVLVVLSSLLHKKYPELFEQLGVVIERAAYKNSQLGDMDVSALDDQVTALMEQEMVYRDESLSLAGLAELLDLKPYQLTEYLNVYKNANFSQFVNTYRVQEAARILLDDQKASVLRTAYSVGFNSKATFNLAFRKILGTSPSEYRKQNRS
jgi:AraC-like DNA-binding protein